MPGYSLRPRGYILGHHNVWITINRTICMPYMLAPLFMPDTTLHTHTSWDWLCHGMQDRQTNKQHFSTHTRAHMLLFNMIVVPRNMEDYTECRISGRMHDGIRTCDAATAVLCIVRIGVSGPYTLTNIEETVSREFGPPFCEIFRKLWCLHTA